MHVIASRHKRPWIKQCNLLAAYLFFFNPLRFLVALVRPMSKIPLADAETAPPLGGESRQPLRRRLLRRLSRKGRAHMADAVVQAFGMWGLTHTFRGTLGWCLRLMRGKITRHSKPPLSQIPMRSPRGGPASHAIPGTPTAVEPVVGNPADIRGKAA
jgi:hypothetical protein